MRDHDAYPRNHRLVDGYRGPIVRVRFGDGREVDVYENDPAIEVPVGALRYAQLAVAARGREPLRMVHWYEQAPDQRDDSSGDPAPVE
jgi:hypothetical protein